MAKPPVSGHNTTSDHLQTWILRVYIHCEGCKKKVYKILQSIDGVYKTVIDSQQHKATVTGSVNGDTLVQKLLRSGKHAEILPESFEAKAAPADSASGNAKKKKKQSNKQNDVVTTGDDTKHVDAGKEESEDATTDESNGGNDQKIAEPAVDGNGDGNVKINDSAVGKKKKNKKKGAKNDNNTQPNGDTEAINPPANGGVTTENVVPSMEQLNPGPPRHQMVYATPYDLPPYPNYYPAPAYGMSYSTSYPSTESSYYAPPVYGYAQSHPSVYYHPLPPPPSYYRRSAFDDHDDEGEGRGCTIM